MAAEGVVRARIDLALKKEAAAILADMGLSLSDAIRLLLVQVVSEKALPFDVRVPNAETKSAMREAREGKVSRFSNVGDLMAELNAGADVEASPSPAGKLQASRPKRRAPRSKRPAKKRRSAAA